MKIPPSALELLSTDALAHIATLNPDGRAHVTCAWVGVVDEEIVYATLSDQRKLENVRRDPRVTISIESPKINDWGLKEYLVVYGTGRITEGGAPEMLQELAHTYLGPDVVFPAFPDPPPGFITRVRVDRVGGVGPWVQEARLSS